MPYYFLDYDDIKEQDLNIEKKDFVSLIETCFKYSSSFSLVFRSMSELNSFNDKFVSLQIEKLTSSDGIRNFKVFYVCNQHNQDQLLKKIDKLFDWNVVNGHIVPEDLTFYHENGKVFFWSETHEGVCALFDSGENISEIVNKRGWRKFDPHKPNLYVPMNLI